MMKPVALASVILVACQFAAWAASAEGIAPEVAQLVVAQSSDGHLNYTPDAFGNTSRIAIVGSTATALAVDDPMQWSGREMLAHFAAPPVEFRPGTVWWWHGGAVTREGVARELQLMKEAPK
jgi:hypothetical protein